MTGRGFRRSGRRQFEEERDNWGHGRVKATWQLKGFFFPIIIIQPGLFSVVVHIAALSNVMCWCRDGALCGVQVQGREHKSSDNQTSYLKLCCSPVISSKAGERIDIRLEEQLLYGVRSGVKSNIQSVYVLANDRISTVTWKRTTIRLNTQQRQFKDLAVMRVVRRVNKVGFSPLWLMGAVKMFGERGAAVGRQKERKQWTNPSRVLITKYISQRSRQSGPDVFGHEPVEWMGLALMCHYSVVSFAELAGPQSQLQSNSAL